MLRQECFYRNDRNSQKTGKQRKYRTKVFNLAKTSKS